MISSHPLRIGILAFALLPGLAGAVTVGETRVLSFIGQPLHLEVELVGADAASMANTSVKLGREADFQRLSMTYQHELAGLTFTPRQQAGGWVVDIRSRTPFDQPFLEFPLTLRSRNTTLVKGVTVLLDPPSYRRPALPVRSAVTETTPPADGHSYTVRPGDSLSQIAQRYRPQDLSTYQMTLALFQANPHAFRDGNIDRLEVGAELRIPQTAGIPAPAKRQAIAEVAARGNGMRTARDIESGNATAAPEARSDDRLQVLQAAPEDEAASAEQLRRNVLLTHEEVEKSRLEQQQMRQQIAEMRDELDHMRRLLNLKDEQIATLQSLVAARKAQVEALVANNPQQHSGAGNAAADSGTATAAQPPGEAATPESGAAGEQVTVTAQVRPVTVAPDAGDVAALARLQQTVDQAIPTPQPAPPSRQWQWWWLLPPLLLLALLLVWRRRRVARHRSMTLAEYPFFLNAQPKPYSQEARKPERPLDEVPLARPPAGVRPQVATAVAATTVAAATAPPRTVAAADLDIDTDSLADDSLSELLDEPLSDLLNLDPLPTPKAAPSAPVDDDTEDLMTEADLDELINQLSAEDTELSTSSVDLDSVSTSGNIDAFWEKLEQQAPQATNTAEATPEPAPAAEDADSIESEPESDHFDLLSELAKSSSPNSQSQSQSQLSEFDERTDPRILSELSEQENLRMDMARAYMELGDREGAIDILQEALQHAVGHSRRQQIEAMLAELK